MREIMKYVAYDGTEFTSRAECLDYEKETMPTHCKMYDHHLEKTEIVTEARFIYVDVDDVIGGVLDNDVANPYGTDGCTTAGWYVFNNEDFISLETGWLNINNIRNELAECEARIAELEQK